MWDKNTLDVYKSSTMAFIQSNALKHPVPSRTAGSSAAIVRFAVANPVATIRHLCLNFNTVGKPSECMC